MSLSLGKTQNRHILAIFYLFSQFCEIDVSLLSLQKQPKTAPNLFQRGVEYGKYETVGAASAAAEQRRDWPGIYIYIYTHIGVYIYIYIYI